MFYFQELQEIFLLSYKNSAIDDNEFSVPLEEFYPTNTSESPHVDRNQRKMKYRVIFQFLNSITFLYFR